jgi:hypothetical protein
MLYNLHKSTVILILGILLTGCDTVYQAMSWDGGYESRQIANNHYWIKYTGNSTTQANWVLLSWQRRAQELCNNNYKVLKIEAPQTLSDNQPIIQTPLNRHNPIVIGEILCLS